MRAAQAQQRVNRLGPYQLLAKIGDGGNSAVHLARMDGPAGFSKLAVVKELRAELTGSNELRALFLNEMRLAARLAHPNVVHAYGANEEGGQLYLAMEYLDGQPWSRIRRVLGQRGTLTLELHLKVLAEVLAGLHYAHELRDYDDSPLEVVHCDVSPQNVLVTYDGLVKVVDFGVARAVFRGVDSASLLVGGRLSYIAPEQLRGDPFDRRADLFAVGVMVWEAVTGQRYAQTKDRSEARRRRELGIGPDMRSVAPAAPAALVEICDHALALDPYARFATAAEFRSALLGFLGEEMQQSDRFRLGVLINDAFTQERAHVHGILERDSKPTGHVTSSVERLIARPTAEPAKLAQQVAATEHSSASQPDRNWFALAGSLGASLRTTLAREVHRQLPALVQRWKLVLPLLGASVAVLSFGITRIASRPDSDALASTARSSIDTDPSLSEAAARPGGPIQVDQIRDLPSYAPLRRPGQGNAAPAPRLSLPVRVPVAPITASMNVVTDARGAVPTTIKLAIAAYPDSALLHLDGMPLSDNPYTARLRADHQVHTVRASATGRVSQTRLIAFDRDYAISFDLEARAQTKKLPPAAPASDSLKKPRAVSYRDPPFASRSPESGDAAYSPGKYSDAYDQPLRRPNPVRPIYEDDPYP